ncbi:CBS domain-containing protein [Asanoa sp. NPDC049573]|uniref:CBS domain-containing protein n=1 Tax=Asanoa sp. NPDC049573 TaxID=3155396 RepID=UPI00344318E7
MAAATLLPCRTSRHGEIAERRQFTPALSTPTAPAATHHQPRPWNGGSEQKEEAMLQWQVRDVMNTDVVTLPDDATVTEVAAVLSGRRISGVPIVDRYDVVTGVVSWTDVLSNIDFGGRPSRRSTAELRWRPGIRTAIDVMSAALVTIRPDASLADAARTMHRRELSRLLVVDDRHRLLGIVTRRDLLAPFSRLDSVIEDDVRQRVLRGTLGLEPETVRVRVDDGEATLTGRVTRRSTALAARRLTEAVPGVSTVVDELAFDADDIAPDPSPPAPAPDPMRGWLNPAPVPAPRSVH